MIEYERGDTTQLYSANEIKHLTRLLPLMQPVKSLQLVKNQGTSQNNIINNLGVSILSRMGHFNPLKMGSCRQVPYN